MREMRPGACVSSASMVTTMSSAPTRSSAASRPVRSASLSPRFPSCVITRRSRPAGVPRTAAAAVPSVLPSSTTTTDRRRPEVADGDVAQPVQQRRQRVRLVVGRQHHHDHAAAASAPCCFCATTSTAVVTRRERRETRLQVHAAGQEVAPHARVAAQLEARRQLLEPEIAPALVHVRGVLVQPLHQPAQRPVVHGHREDEQAARLQQAVRAVEHRRQRGDVLDDVEGGHHVEAAPQRQRVQAGHQQRHPRGQEPPRLLHRVLGGVAADAVEARGRFAQEEAVPAARLQQRAAVAEAQQLAQEGAPLVARVAAEVVGPVGLLEVLGGQRACSANIPRGRRRSGPRRRRRRR